MSVGRMLVGQILIGQMSVGQILISHMSVGQMSVGQMSVGQMVFEPKAWSQICCHHGWFNRTDASKLFLKVLEFLNLLSTF